MRGACECGMTFEQRPGPASCTECGARGCSSCAIKIEADTYCRWCAPLLAPAA